MWGDRKVLFLGLCLLLAAPFSSAAELNDDETLADALIRDSESQENYDVNFYMEDDWRHMSFWGSDRAYTFGWRLSFVKAVEELPPLMKPLFDWLTDSDSTFNYGFAGGQQMYTPLKISAYMLITNDQPYAGYLYGGASLHIRNDDVLHSFEVDLGVVGPPSLAEAMQTNYHRIMGFPDINGWGNQLTTEPTVALFYQQKRTLLIYNENSGSRIFDLTGNAEGAIGNLYDYIGLGAQIRLGYELTDDFGPTVSTPVGVDRFVESGTDRSKVEVYLFASLDGRVMGRNLFLDGSTFKPSHHVNKQNFVYDFDFGAAVRLSSLTLSWRQFSRSKEFSLENGAHHFGSVLLNYSRRF